MVKLNLKIVFASFATSCIVLLALGFLLVGNYVNGSVSKTEHPEFNFVIPNSQDINLLITVCEENPKPPDVYLLLKISACDNVICAANFPKTLVTIVDTKRGNLQELFDWGGVDFVKTAIENITDVEIDSTIQLDNSGLNQIIWFLRQNNSSNYFKNEKLSEANFVDQNCFCESLRQDPINDIFSLKNYINVNTDLSDLFFEVSSVANMSMSNYDFEIRKMGFKQMLFNSNCELIIPELHFENVYGHDRLTDDSKLNVYKIFKKISTK